LFTGLRVLVMEYVLDPIARYNGIKTRKGLVRFKEQAWLAMYCTCSWSLGMVSRAKPAVRRLQCSSAMLTIRSVSHVPLRVLVQSQRAVERVALPRDNGTAQVLLSRAVGLLHAADHGR
jgi:hypothetical protein